MIKPVSTPSTGMTSCTTNMSANAAVERESFTRGSWTVRARRERSWWKHSRHVDVILVGAAQVNTAKCELKRYLNTQYTCCGFCFTKPFHSSCLDTCRCYRYVTSQTLVGRVVAIYKGAAQRLPRANTSFMLVLCSRQIPAKANKLILSYLIFL